MAKGPFAATLRHVHRLAGIADAGTLSDRQLLERFARDHDEAAFASLVRRHAQLVLGVCWRVLHHPQDAEDVFQATFLVLARRAGAVSWRESVGNWLYEVAHRLAVKARAAAARRQVHERRAAAEAESTAEPAAAWQQLCAVLDEEVRRLPERYRIPLLLSYLEGRTRDQAARQLGCSRRTLQRRLDEGLALLRGRLSRRGVTLSATLLAGGLAQKAAAEAMPAVAVASLARAAADFAAGRAAGALGVSAGAAALAEEGCRLAAGTTWKLLTAALLAVSLAGAWIGRPAKQAPAAEPPREAKAEAPKPAAPGEDRLAAKERAVLKGHGDIVHTAAFAPDGKVLVSVAGPLGKAGEVILWDPATGKEKARLQETQGVRSVAFARDGKTFATAEYEGAVIKLRDAGTGAARAELRGHGKEANTLVNTVAFSPDGRTLAAGYLDGTVELWDVPGREVRTSFSAGDRGVYAVAVSPDGRTLATGGQDGIVKLWDLATGRPRAALAGHQREVEHIAFSPDGKTIASASWDLTIKLWEAATGEERLTLKGHGVEILGVAFSPDGRVLASADGAWGPYEHPNRVGRRPGEVRLWDALTGRKLGSLAGHEDRVWGVAFSPDGRTLASASWDQTVRLWELPRRDPVAGTQALADADWEARWRDLAAADAALAFRAVGVLIGARQTVPLLAERVRPAKAEVPDASRIARLIKELDDDSFTVRDKASAELARLGKSAEPALRKALEKAPSAEVRLRLERLLEKMDDSPALRPEELQALRAVEILEHVGTPPARKVLETLAGGPPEARLSREAKAALERLARRPTP